MNTLTSHERKELPTRTFADPKARKYPIPNVAHARDALSRVSANGSPTVKAMVRAEVHRRFPQIKESKK
jgi:hypothetical protein